jgi:hypothetical protein
MPAKKEEPKIEATPEVPVHRGLYCGTHLAAKLIICSFALFLGFSILVAAFGTGFAAGRLTSRGDSRDGMMKRGGYGQQYGGGMMNRGGSDYYKNGPGQNQGKGQCPVIPDNQSNGSDSEELPPNNAPVTP